MPTANISSRVIAFLVTAGDATADRIGEAIGEDGQDVAVVLLALADEGKVERVRPNLWRAVSSPVTTFLA